MPRSVSLGGLVLLGCAVVASAGTLRCQSVDGNLNCAGSRAVGCQSVNGRTVCTSGGDDGVRSFGQAAPLGDRTDAAMEDPSGDAPIASTQRIEQHGPGGHTLIYRRDGSRIHLRTDRLRIDRE